MRRQRQTRLFDGGLIFLIIVLSGAALTDAKYPFDADAQAATERETLAAGQEWIDRYLYTPQA